ncbi:MAG: hypothetical protein A2X13_01385 [Bacteroidetes bacterium GWC2_33_15]|nr:MAG: hypothetical protein A2X10_08240 [Bacteroidetes bacterium GWA2_33_15]OFX52137.1 MAG: hypothetical protein A2X13_01385 [Bacteroidetes bacterium GWC2_33_15]OFX64291.1 MAG: hypothetical protein A2X15_12205 [Bacteroidetes bacterium GWB2_32_14]OFX67696.1 MAG: hypothetical protein A2X14_06030 [Bacteroidetes bacterium GWD2_33_33]HAN19304.1 hypothetical protein [Bacteroidales bacterium]
MKNILKIKFSVLFAMIVFLFSCETDDNTGYSNLEPTSPSISISNPYASINLIEKDSVFTFDVTLSEAQVVDIYVYIKQIDGDAEQGADFVIVNDAGRLTIPFGATTGQLMVKVLADDLAEGTETFTIQMGDERTANATITPVTVDFSIQNSALDELSIDMTWETDVFEATGLELDPDEVGDLRLLIFDQSDNLLVDVDGSSFENYSGMDTLSDGTYKIAAAFYSTIDVGDFNSAITFSVTLDFFQSGVLDESLIFDKVFDNLFPCYDFRVYLASITKSGSTYTFEKEISYSTPARTTWYGSDCLMSYGDYPSEVETAEGCNGELLIYGLNAWWISDFWGETIVDEGHVRYEINEYTKEITIAEQYVFTTDYDGDLYPYTIKGTGTYDDSGTYPTMHIEYYLDQDGYDPGYYAYSHGYMATEYFEANLTLDPAGKNVINVNADKEFDLSKKPVR